MVMVNLLRGREAARMKSGRLAKNSSVMSAKKSENRDLEHWAKHMHHLKENETLP
jgi:hypothetical protein